MIMYKVNPYFTAKLIVIMHIVNPDEKGEVYCTKILIMIMYSVNSDEKGWVHCTTIFIMIMYSVNPDEKGWVYCTGIKHGNEEDWDLAWDRLQVSFLVLILILFCKFSPLEIVFYKPSLVLFISFLSEIRIHSPLKKRTSIHYAYIPFKL